MDIVGLVLEAAIGGATKAKIMDWAYLSILQSKDYLFVLLENGLLCYGKGTWDIRDNRKGIKNVRKLQSYQ